MNNKLSIDKSNFKVKNYALLGKLLMKVFIWYNHKAIVSARGVVHTVRKF